MVTYCLPESRKGYQAKSKTPVGLKVHFAET